MTQQYAHASTLEAFFESSHLPRDPTQSLPDKYQDYWNLDDIIAEEELIPCTFKFNGDILGVLAKPDSQQSSANSQRQRQIYRIEQTLASKVGFKADVPLWLGIQMAQRDLMEIQSPKLLRNQFLNQLRADSDIVTIRAVSPYVYEVAFKILKVINNYDAKPLIKLFQASFISRFNTLIIPNSSKCTVKLADDFSGSAEKRLSFLEREIYTLNKSQALQYSRWRNKELEQVQRNPDFIFSRENQCMMSNFTIPNAQHMQNTYSDSSMNRKRIKLR
ncbi:hypothetical protein FGO68_gene6320 [Halteria grandinella]|uniref:GINS subunit domain-containing protein n=1 Tax=Halteria grandinella TaxID=5974 RepID=A0A8J8NKU1_HALGN|nr:hypothetical protein FGO68_gene6320 [Halteria grandinella]